MDVKRSAARGRVAVYQVHLSRILQATKVCWPQLGPDFEARLQTLVTPEPSPAPNIVPFAPKPSLEHQNDVWGRALALLDKTDPTLASAWFQHLTFERIENGTAILSAPSRFMAGYVETHLRTRLLQALSASERDCRDLRIVASQAKP